MCAALGYLPVKTQIRHKNSPDYWCCVPNKSGEFITLTKQFIGLIVESHAYFHGVHRFGATFAHLAKP